MAYTRCTTYVSSLEDTSNLTDWKLRMALTGVADNPHLALMAAVHRDNKREMKKVADEAITLAGGSQAASKGTALHAFTERLDRGEDLKGLPAEYAADLEAYRQATAGMEMKRIEQFVVLDDIRVAGTTDRVVYYDGNHYIADVKTGRLDFGAGKIAMQLAVYAHGVEYDIETGKRSHLPVVDELEGIVIHLPAGQGTCTLYKVDIYRAWEWVSVAGRVRDFRKIKDWLEPIGKPVEIKPPTLSDRIETLGTADAIRALWAEHESEWTDSLTEVAKKRIAALAA